MKVDPMTWDPSNSSQTPDTSDPQTSSLLNALGWQPFFAQQISAKVLLQTPPARVIEVHRSALHILGEGIDETIPFLDDATVGDWVLLDRERPQDSAVLERKSLIKRRAPGSDRQVQKIAANIDTAFLVSSCNRDFNVARLERYIALAFEAQITPVILLTKIDLVDDVQAFVDAAQTISDRVPVITVDARHGTPHETLAPWSGEGQTLAFLGSSGVGKSTLTNALLGEQSIQTQAVRAIDARGRHTTTRRQLYHVPKGCMVLDTPGMRELQLTDVAAGIEDLFADLNALSAQCRFNNCSHLVEPGCAILKAQDAGELDPARLDRWRKLIAEEAANTASLTGRKAKEAKSRERALGRTVKRTKKANKKK